uniref:Secreted protein n=1 Tax=Rhizophora mucronata TaxID=61149 RepID=A0A2P2Q8N9_RHIMU
MEKIGRGWAFFLFLCSFDRDLNTTKCPQTFGGYLVLPTVQWGPACYILLQSKNDHREEKETYYEWSSGTVQQHVKYKVFFPHDFST